LVQSPGITVGDRLIFPPDFCVRIVRDNSALIYGQKTSRKPSHNQIRWLCQIIVALIVLIMPVAITLRLVLAFLFALMGAIALLAYRISCVAPWQLELLKSPNHRVAFLESLFFTTGSFGLLIYLIASAQAIVHFACGFLGIIKPPIQVLIVRRGGDW